MDEERNLEGRTFIRRHLLLYLKVLNLDTDRLVGRLGDINSKGVLLLTMDRLEAGSVFPIGIVIPETVDAERSMLELVVEVRWCRQDARPDMYAAGCSITSIEEADREYIETLIDRIGFSDGTRKIFLKNDRNVFMDVGEAE